MKTRKESEYIICSVCKQSIIIAKFDPLHNNVMVNLERNPFNPYELPPYHPQYLERNFESVLVQEKIQAQQERVRQMTLRRINSPGYIRNPSFSPAQKFNIYKPLMDTIKEIGDRIKSSGYIPLSNRINRDRSSSEGSFYNDKDYMSSITSHLPKIS